MSINLGAIRSCVTDGVSIGHPCCAVHDCPNPLLSRKGARYCMEHSAQEQQCAVLVCKASVEEGHKTCSDPEHRRLETWLDMQQKAMFQLKLRYERSQRHSQSSTASVPITSIPSDVLERIGEDSGGSGAAMLDETLDEALDNGIVECDAKSTSGNRTHRAQFGRRRTHNEELCVASCGVILGRATFMGSEAINGVLVRLVSGKYA